MPEKDATDTNAVPGEAPAKISYPKAVAAELAKTVWPTRAELVRNTAITLVFTIAATAALAGADYGLSELAARIFAS